MPATRGRPTLYETKVATITFKINESIYGDIYRYAIEHGLSVPAYVGMMMNLHVRGVKDDEKRIAQESADA